MQTAQKDTEVGVCYSFLSFYTVGTGGENEWIESGYQQLNKALLGFPEGAG